MYKKYYEEYKKNIPKLKKEYFKAKIRKDINMILEIKEYIWSNWNLTVEQKKEIINIIGIKE